MPSNLNTHDVIIIILSSVDLRVWLEHDMFDYDSPLLSFCLINLQWIELEIILKQCCALFNALSSCSGLHSLRTCHLKCGNISISLNVCQHHLAFSAHYSEECNISSIGSDTSNRVGSKAHFMAYSSTIELVSWWWWWWWWCWWCLCSKMPPCPWKQILTALVDEHTHRVCRYWTKLLKAKVMKCDE